ILGTPSLANGMYAGWSVGQANFQDSRPESQKVEGMYWGPIPEKSGRWKGTYINGNSVLLSYSISGVDILELPGSKVIDNELVFIRTFKVGPSSENLILNVTQVNKATNAVSESERGHL